MWTLYPLPFEAAHGEQEGMSNSDKESLYEIRKHPVPGSGARREILLPHLLRFHGERVGRRKRGVRENLGENSPLGQVADLHQMRT